ncbi:mannose-1-phosphate guanylyltransferase [Gracilimonas amylolytica]|uniref:mannose-1-phosphate guanylyltransferase n=1 Tax=Gracilimonas amylolytica TaxID=1749045 RepID=UPI000CD96383|nr:mannose-1-phosphate guanylyltransferase [Gracilimonas amylolytica]
MIYAVIMAGGSGTRFWPRSTKELPKQFLSLFGEGTMIQNTARRVESMIPQENILVVTNDNYLDIVKDQLPSVPEENIIGEPVAKNTAPCVAIAAQLLYKKDPEAVMVVLPADHHIEDPDAFKRYLTSAVEKAKSGSNLVTIGIEPDRPETGYGYIQGDDSGSEKVSGNDIYSVKAFKEKPDLDTAKQFIKEGNYYWNSGMFIWSAKTILDEFSKHLPDMYKLIEQANDGLYEDQHKESIDQFYHSCESISIDYGIMEHAREVFVVPGEFGWNDVGSWTAVYDLGEKDDSGNVINTDASTLSETTNSYAYSKSGKMISLVGLDNVAVVETDDAILVCKLDKAQNVKDIVEQLKSNDQFKKFL